MLPEQDDLLFEGAAEVEEEQQTSRTYRLNHDAMTIEGILDEVEALKQTIYCILRTERFEHEMYSGNYGIELVDTIGQPMEFTLIEIEEYIKEALEQDDRILRAFNFETTEMKNSAHVAFEVESIFGSLEINSEVSLYAG